MKKKAISECSDRNRFAKLQVLQFELFFYVTRHPLSFYFITDPHIVEYNDFEQTYITVALLPQNSIPDQSTFSRFLSGSMYYVIKNHFLIPASEIFCEIFCKSFPYLASFLFLSAIFFHRSLWRKILEVQTSCRSIFTSVRCRQFHLSTGTDCSLDLF